MANVRTNPHAPSIGGKASLLARYEEKAIPRGQIPPIETGRRAAHLCLRMTDIGHKVRVTIGEVQIADGDGAQHLPRILRERLAPDAIDGIKQAVVRFMNFQRAGPTMDA